MLSHVTRACLFQYTFVFISGLRLILIFFFLCLRICMTICVCEQLCVRMRSRVYLLFALVRVWEDDHRLFDLREANARSHFPIAVSRVLCLSLLIMLPPERRCMLSMVTCDQRHSAAPSVTHAQPSQVSFCSTSPCLSPRGSTVSEFSVDKDRKGTKRLSRSCH